MYAVLNTKLRIGIFIAYLFYKGKFAMKARNKPKVIYARKDLIRYKDIFYTLE